MTIIQITPGAGAMYCGNCFRDNALVRALRKKGHQTLMVPLYLPLTLEDADESAGTPIFFGGISVYLEQKSALFRRGPRWMHRLLASPLLLKWAAGRAAKTRASEVGDLTISMLRGQDGNQTRELGELISWLKQQPAPDVIFLSNALLMGLVQTLKAEFQAPIVCMLQGEDSFLDALPPGSRELAWKLLADRARQVDLFIAPSEYFASVMTQRLKLPEERLQVVFNGIDLDNYQIASSSPNPPVLGYFARMCPDKGLDTLVETFILLKERGRVPHLRLRVGGGLGPTDRAFVATLQQRLREKSLERDVEFCPNLTRAQKLEFFRSLSVFSTPATYSEAFGLYVIEALAAGVPVVQPRHAAFPELIEATGGGLLCEPRNPASLAEAIEKLLLDPERARAHGRAGRDAVFEHFSIEVMAGKIVGLCRELQRKNHSRFSATQPVL